MPIITIKIVETIVMDTDTNQIISTTRTVENSEGVAAPIKKVSAPKRKEVVVDDNIDDEVFVKLDDNKLVLSKAAALLLKANPGDRVCISYNQLKNGTFVPVSGTQEKMGDNVSGNKLTKALTVAYKGKQATTLSQYGNYFILDLLDDGTAQLNDVNHKGMEDISDDELIPMPIITENSSSLSANDFLDNLNQSSTTDLFEKSDDSVTFEFDFNEGFNNI